jgi:uncharacterized protein
VIDQTFWSRDFMADLVARKTGGPEKGTLDDADFSFHESEVQHLHALLEASAAESPLPETGSARGALKDLLLRIRLGAGR